MTTRQLYNHLTDVRNHLSDAHSSNHDVSLSHVDDASDILDPILSELEDDIGDESPVLGGCGHDAGELIGDARICAACILVCAIIIACGLVRALLTQL